MLNQNQYQDKFIPYTLEKDRQIENYLNKQQLSNSSYLNFDSPERQLRERNVFSIHSDLINYQPQHCPAKFFDLGGSQKN